jgi:hypothetical protein
VNYFRCKSYNQILDILIDIVPPNIQNLKISEEEEEEETTARMLIDYTLDQRNQSPHRRFLVNKLIRLENIRREILDHVSTNKKYYRKDLFNTANENKTIHEISSVALNPEQNFSLSCEWVNENDLSNSGNFGIEKNLQEFSKLSENSGSLHSIYSNLSEEHLFTEKSNQKKLTSMNKSKKSCWSRIKACLCKI